MKRIQYKLISTALVVVFVSFLFSSCQKSFDPNSYAPARTFGGFTSSQQIAPSNLVGYWAFNGSLMDSISGTSATNSATTFSNGVKGQSLQGNENGYATFNPGSALQNLKSFTIAFWMNAPATGTFGVFSLANTNDFWGNIDIYQDGGSGDLTTFKVHINNASGVPWGGQFTDTKVSIGKWVHIAATYDGATSRFNIYQNGVPIGLNSAGNPANSIGPALNGSDPSAPPVTPYGNLKFVNATAMVFGTFQFQTNPSLTGSAGSQGWAHNFAGGLDEFRIYDKAISANDVKALYQLENLGL